MRTKDFILLGAGYAAGRLSKKMNAGPIGAVKKKDKVYLNMKTPYGVETIDEFTREPSQSPIKFRRYVSEMIKNYRAAGMNVYKSIRPTKNWNN